MLTVNAGWAKIALGAAASLCIVSLSACTMSNQQEVPTGMESAPLTLQQNPPPTPPSVSIRSSNSSEAAAIGELLLAEGFSRGGNVRFDTATPPAWPPTHRLSAAETVHLGTPVRPRAVNVKVFPAVPGGVGIPEEPVASLDCWLDELDTAQCGLRMAEDGLTLRMPRVGKGDYSIVVYVAWPNVEGTDINTTSASWMFSVTIST